MFLLLFWGAMVGLTSAVLPSMRDSLSNPVHVYEGDDALITCVVRNVGSNTVMWKKEDRERHSTRVLTAGENRVTADKRYGVLHDSDPISETPDGITELPSGGDVWVLVIENSKPTDSGVYVCEVNSSPTVRSFHKLSVLSKSMLPPNYTTTDPSSSGEDQRQLSSKNHNYTDCCVAKNVSTVCLGFCNIQSILEDHFSGTTGQDPEQCETDFPSIVSCMADGRNHVPCCIQERVPDICQDVCRGEYTAITDNIKTHFSCSSYTEQTLACIVEGIELLPSPPMNVEVEALTEKSLRVQWTLPVSNTETITEFAVNVTSLKSFDIRKTSNSDSATFTQSVLVKVPVSQTSTILQNLIPFTMYDITVTAINRHGSSLPSYSVRSLTLTPGSVKQTTTGRPPQLPDIKSCCANKGIVHKTCVTKLCDPVQASSAEITDLMICAPWAADTFGCLTNGMDHTPCCKARGLPDICQQLCTGNVSSIDFNYFKCLRYMSEYTNCLLQGYGVLPSAPTEFHVTNIETEFAILHWSQPKTLGDTVSNYNLFIRNADDELSEYTMKKGVRSPYIAENLESETDYEVYVEAVNAHGVGTPSAMLTFRTESKIVEEKIEEALVYNVTGCCVEAQVNSVCLPLCSFNANMTDLKALASVCKGDYEKILKCAAGGRNHATCCHRRGVPSGCLPVCNGVLLHQFASATTSCVPYIGNIAQCFEEGAGKLPGPISGLHAVIIDGHSILLEWNVPDNSTNVTDYVVYYQKVDNTSMYETVSKLDQHVNTTLTTATLTGLEEKQMYHIFVVSRNQEGTSLPSSIIVIKLVKEDVSKWVNGVTSPPHSLAVASHSATWVMISWQPPEFSHPSELISYRVFHKSTAEEQFHSKNVSVNSYMLNNLNPNTQYIVYIQAVSEKGVSMPSETLIAWTDPAYPAFVEPPTVHPINLVIEGSSMTILCIAMGTPMPTISLYISGRLVRQETTRHMVTVIHNVTKDMDQISCYADNGYGTPMQASRKIIISHGPHIQASGITMTTLGDSVTLECKVEAQPEPKMIFWRNHEDRTPVIQGGKYDITAKPVKDEDDKYIMQLTIKQITDMDVGDYYCHAENAFGSSTQPVSVRIRNLASVNNLTQCCLEQNVTSPCMDACSFYLDIDAVIDKLECVQDFGKLMKCASDGSDHRSCCAHQKVSRRCLDWCRGEPVLNNKACVLAHTKQIMSCFHEGRDKLPGPPQNIHVDFIDSHSVNINWNPPIKNPHTVELYRVMLKLNDPHSKENFTADTATTHIKFQNLRAGATYALVIKAGNSKGTSTLTEPLKFTMSDKYITSAASQEGQDGHVGVIVAVILALIVVAAIFAGAVWFMRNKKMLGIKNSNGIAFENPSYLREVNMDHIQVPQRETETTQLANGSANGIAVSSSSGGQGWKNEALHVPAQQEVNPTLYEELKLGQDGAGFKRLKP
ncbi:Ig-like and fibronectin type-III domain-containing protein 2 isoform X1 [Diabrotica virgifera virgifera]|uniref:Ig-like and fibronectin type-III domain-containing protein 2 n=2 Tax=Diabrotica virgifera virgifera TaxID=50390 RepID=A0ABM5K2A8_DIAVI|nr:Ig-like and fibronectin type-III domain-containing protein 2 isoform X1 [Diabrotica virgifera virgifera]XP_050504318.1 Ig-like and fibronectin type-III domain-containing protein 2 isoform X1 [Diabrotica virgifera virgifera]XP_050504324.1 Ig-like and fibronectin type-III domain-containing protein 2 isoform X1 [Diabrotica virgifera virgifera]XP_050504330.1 Ig-like and fibronectin type-III domain-containing protein 2 isoform X1 [Diabrotica virgifera virgifera]XP_050504335.1 Ig-like and fibronec